MRKLLKPAAAVALALVMVQIAAAATSPANGGSLAFTSLRGGTAAAYVANGDGTGVRRLTEAGVGAYQGDAAWSPDGSRIVFTCGNFELCVAAADGSGAARLTTSTWPSSWSYDFEPAWSPDGARIVFSAKRGSSSADLWVVNADGTGLARLVEGATEEGSPEWSPDGSRIAYDKETNDGSDLYVVNADGTGVQRLTSGKMSESDPDWSPDGTSVAYTRGAADSFASEIWLMTSTGGGQRRLTAGGEPSWSPDGTSLYFSGPQGTDDELFSIRPDGSGRTRLTTSRGGDFTPQLQPAGVTVTLPQMPTTPLAPVNPDARIVGTLIVGSAQVLRDLSGFDTSQLSALVAAARSLGRDAAIARRALLSSQSTSARGAKVRTEGAAGFAAAQRASANLLEVVRLAPQGKKAAKRIAALDKVYRANITALQTRLLNAYRMTGLSS